MRLNTEEIDKVTTGSQSRAQAIVEAVKTIEINDEATAAAATDLAKQIRSALDRIEEERKSLVSPIRTAVETINGKFKIISEPLLTANTIVREKLGGWLEYKEAINREENERRRKEAEATAERIRAEQASNPQAPQQEAPRAEMMPATIEKARPASTIVRSDAGASSNVRKVWKWRVTDKVALMKAHAELFVVDAKEIDKLVKTGLRDLPGVEFYEDSTVVVR